jgi:hypothetical protein
MLLEDTFGCRERSRLEDSNGSLNGVLDMLVSPIADAAGRQSIIVIWARELCQGHCWSPASISWWRSVLSWKPRQQQEKYAEIRDCFDRRVSGWSSYSIAKNT